jgi:titin
MHLPLWRTSIRGPTASSKSPSRRRVRSRHFLPLVETLEGRWVPSTFLVTTTDDTSAGSLRQAILDANATPGTNEIVFAVGDGGPQTIRPTSPLPAVTHTVTIDGTTQPGFVDSPLIEINGTDAGFDSNGLVIRADNCTLQGLMINAFRDDIHDITDSGIVIIGSGNVVQGNCLGTDGTSNPSVGNNAGVFISAGSNNRIGGTTAGERNLFAGNDAGIRIDSSNNVVQGNYFGTDATGTAGLGNLEGLLIRGSNNQIGGTTAAARNIISSSGYAGVYIFGNSNLIQGNYIGTDVSGTQALGGSRGVLVAMGSSNTIGGAAPGAGNLISGNNNGVEIGNGGNTVQGNLIGTDVTGTRALGNQIGVFLQGPSGPGSLIGGTAAGAGNLISGNRGDGVQIVTNDVTVQGNLIGTDSTGTLSLGNGGNGVYLRAWYNTVGGTAAGAGNVIAANGADGIATMSGGNVVQGNFIGTDSTGTRALGNARGLYISLPSNTIGGTAAGAGNLIAGNRSHGVEVTFGSGEVVQGNRIGTDASGSQVLGNGGHGVLIEDVSNSLIGGQTVGAGNLICANQGNGVYLTGPGQGNLIQGNIIGTDATGSQPLGNGGDGLHLQRTNNNTVGGEAPGAGNTIAFNGNDGVLVDQGTGNAILGNAIFANANLGIELVRGGNHDQAAPVITSANTDGVSTTVSGTLTSAPNSTFTLEFFASSPGDPSGAERFLGSVQVTTDASGNASFMVTMESAVDPGWFLTATATDFGNNTSAFSTGVEVTE